MERFDVTRIVLLLCFALFSIPVAAAPQVQQVVGGQGLKAWLIEDHSQPVLHVSFSFRGGAALDPMGKEGLAHMVSTLLDEGAGDLNSQAFQRQLEDLSIDLSFAAGRDGFTGSLKTLTRNLDQAEHLLGLALSAPRFDTDPVERMRAQILAERRRSAEDADDIASRQLLGLLFPNHPYGRESRGTTDSISGLTRADFRDFVERRLARDKLVVGLFGDITPERAKQFLDRAFGKLPAAALDAAVPDVMPQLTGKMTVIDRNLQQSVILFAQAGLLRESPDFYVAQVLDYILGGGSFSSRLYDEVREKRGLAYSVGTYLWPMDHAAIYMGQAGTANARAAETVKIVRDQWTILRESGPSPEEVADAKTYLTGSYPLRFTSGGALASTLVAMQIHNLGQDYLDRREDYINAVTPEDVARLARQLLDPQRLTFVVVGRPEGL
ncbi:pitrilysin family protein [Magnetospira thiophila]